MSRATPPPPIGHRTFAPSASQRVATIGGGIAVIAVILHIAWNEQGGSSWLVFTPLGAVIVLEGVRARVVVDRDSGVVRSTRAFVTLVVAIDEIAAVHIPPWGPIQLRLLAGHERSFLRRLGPWKGQVGTGLYAHRHGADAVALKLSRTIGVPLESSWAGRGRQF